MYWDLVNNKMICSNDIFQRNIQLSVLHPERRSERRVTDDAQSFTVYVTDDAQSFTVYVPDDAHSFTLYVLSCGRYISLITASLHTYGSVIQQRQKLLDAQVCRFMSGHFQNRVRYRIANKSFSNDGRSSAGKG